jgi:predicted DNA-binding transcriptional regulator AlpA
MTKPTFDELPEAVAKLNEKLDYILELLSNPPETEFPELMSVKQLIEYLPENPARPTVYGWVNNRKIPYEKHGKCLYFRKSIIDEWLNKGRQMDC